MSNNFDIDVINDHQNRYWKVARGKVIFGLACSIFFGFYQDDFTDGALMFIAFSLLIILESLIDLTYYQERQSIRKGEKQNL